MRRYIDLTESLTEAPITDFQLVGDFDKSSSIRKPVDRKLLSNEKAVRKINAQWAKTDYDFNFYFVNLPEGRGKSELGVVSMEWLEENLPKTAAVFKYERDAINVIFTNNVADQHVPMTGWIIAHRLSHAMDARRASYEVTEARNRILEVMGSILRDGYDLKQAPNSVRSWSNSRYMQSSINWDVVYRRFYEAIGTMRSARERKIRNEFEFLHELFAQYIITGKVKFNPVPRHFSFRIGNERSGAMIRPNDMEYFDGLLEDLAEELGYTFSNILGSMIGRILVM